MKEYKNFIKVMASKGVFGIIIAFAAILFCVSCSTSRKVGSENKSDALIGVWKQTSPGWSGGREVTKIITKGHFLVILSFDNVIEASFGGTYSVSEDGIIEKIEFGTPNRRQNVGIESSVKYKIEDNKMHVSWQIQRGLFLNWDNEIWERLE